MQEGVTASRGTGQRVEHPLDQPVLARQDGAGVGGAGLVIDGHGDHPGAPEAILHPAPADGRVATPGRVEVAGGDEAANPVRPWLTINKQSLMYSA